MVELFVVLVMGIVAYGLYKVWTKKPTGTVDVSASMASGSPSAVATGTAVLGAGAVKKTPWRADRPDADALIKAAEDARRRAEERRRERDSDSGVSDMLAGAILGGIAGSMVGVSSRSDSSPAPDYSSYGGGSSGGGGYSSSWGGDSGGGGGSDGGDGGGGGE